LGWGFFHLIEGDWQFASNFCEISKKLNICNVILQLMLGRVRDSISGGAVSFKPGCDIDIPFFITPNLPRVNVANEFLDISICSDKGSWINEWIPELIQSSLKKGCKITWFHNAEEAPGGDCCFYLSYGRIVNHEVRSRYKHNLVVHESHLPKGRGWAPMSWQILGGASIIAVTLLEAEDNIDSGDIYMQDEIMLEGHELNSEWRTLQAKSTLKLCLSFLCSYPRIVDQARPQTGQPSFYRRRSAEDSLLDLQQSIGEQLNLLRIVSNEDYPAFFELDGHRFYLHIYKSRCL